MQQGDVVYLPSFICRDVLAPVHELGGRVEFYDVDRSLRPIMPDRRMPARAILAVNYFGFPQYLADLQRFADDVGAVVIEDNAHGYLSRDQEGIELGRRTGLGFTSFRKTLRVVNGAFLDVDLDKFPSASGLEESAPTTTRLPLSFQIRRLTANVERVTRLPLLNTGRATVRSMRRLAGRSVIPELDESEHMMPAHRAVHVSALHTMHVLNHEHEVQRRRQLFAQIASRLRVANVDLVFPGAPPNASPWCVAFYATPTQLADARRAVRGLGVEIFQWPDLPSDVVGACPDFYSQVHVISMMK